MSFQIVRYGIHNRKIRGNCRVLFLSDLHNYSHGEFEEELIRAVYDAEADLILIGGDMVIQRNPENGYSEHFLKALKDCPLVCYANGNHETGVKKYHPKRYREWISMLEEQGMIVLNNSSKKISVNGTDLCVYGYEAPLSLYRKFKRHHLSTAELEEAVSRPDPEAFNILLAHNPTFGDTYFDWGADLICSGHNHGGVMRLYGNRILLSPYGFPFPRYGYGFFEKNGRSMIVTSGLGEHTIPVRIHNPMEIILIELKPE